MGLLLLGLLFCRVPEGWKGMSSAALRWTFGPFAVDPANACLWRGTEAVALSPKAFAVLHYLVQHPNRVVTKDELLDAVWPETAVTDVVVRVAIGILRKALDDTAPPRFIATVPRRGYRFLAPVTVTDASESTDVLPPPHTPLTLAPPPLLVGREAMLQQLGAAWTRARQGQRQVVWVTGEAGIGKTTVVEAFRAVVATDPAVWLAAGQCVEHYGTGEAYLPVLEALGQLCRGPGGVRLVELLQQHAPTWLVQMPWLLTAAHREQLHDELGGATRERMLREFVEVVDALTAETPLVLILEDLHWSDYATLDLLALLARRQTPAHLLVVGTYRPVEVIVHHHPLHTVVQDLQRHGHATELPLALLSAEAVAAYLAARFPRQQFPAMLGPWLHQRTDGHPLFLVTLVQALVEWGVLHAHDGCWTVQEGLETLALHVPESLRQLLEQQITRLPSEAQRVLDVASVAGVEFVAAAVAAGLEADAATVEEHCETLVGQQLLRPLGVTTWPNGTVATRYAFVHALYQQVVYQGLGAGRRVRLHQRLGECLETAYGSQVREVAAELAEHFVRGRDRQRAVRYVHQAAENAAQRQAHREAIVYLRQALELLKVMAETPQLLQQELAIQLALGPALMVTRGFADPEVTDTYARARQLCEQLDDTQQLFPVLVGLWRSAHVQAQLQTARALGEQLLNLARAQGDLALLVEAHGPLGQTLCMQGEPLLARQHLHRVVTLYEPHRHSALVFHVGYDPGIYARAMEGWVLWLLGYPEQALQRSQDALGLAREQSHPFTLSITLATVALLQQMRRDGEALLEPMQASMVLATEHEFPYLRAVGIVLQGWALTRVGQVVEGMVQMREGLAELRAMGSEVLRPYLLALLAEVYGSSGQLEAGLGVLEEALVTAENHAERFNEADLHRLKGDLLLRQCGAAGCEAEACFQRALDIARHQQAKSLELRAATSLAQLWQQQGKRANARQLLAEVYGWFTEGFGTADLQEAKALLDAF
jgi:DNA-binding winged helix-turn-helix (wHTH) protein/predicted ATPase